jgi:hypothetical protein
VSRHAEVRLLQRDRLGNRERSPVRERTSRGSAPRGPSRRV